MREQLAEILALERQQLGQRRAPAALVARHDHLAHRADALGIEEHVLGAAQADALGAELARGLGVQRGFGVGAHAASGASSSAHSISVAKSPDMAGSIIATAPDEHLAGGAVEGDGLARPHRACRRPTASARRSRR